MHLTVLTLLPAPLLWRCTSAMATSSLILASVSSISLASRKFCAYVIPYDTLSLQEPHFHPWTVVLPFMLVSQPHMGASSPLEQPDVIWWTVRADVRAYTNADSFVSVVCGCGCGWVRVDVEVSGCALTCMHACVWRACGCVWVGVRVHSSLHSHTSTLIVLTLFVDNCLVCCFKFRSMSKLLMEFGQQCCTCNIIERGTFLYELCNFLTPNILLSPVAPYVLV